ncbi:MAG: class I SAM-dependent methyltransferase [Chloroflexota bacterium]|nr:class I SAM-dependent methyltransferase [Chloroflexota bacterium]
MAASPGLPGAEPPLTEVMQRALTVLWALGPKIVLDLGCGPGRETLALTALPGVRVVAVDTDREALAAAPAHRNVLYVKADATRLPLASDAAQAAYSFGLLQALGRSSDAPTRDLMQELQRVIDASGVAVMGTLADFRRSERPDRSLTGAEVSKALRGRFVLQELIGLIDLEHDGQRCRYWYIAATPIADG